MKTMGKIPQLTITEKDSEIRGLFNDLPPEVLSSICDHLYELREVDISVTNRCPPARLELRYRFSDPFKELRSLLRTSKWTREGAEAWISRSIQFFADSTRFEHVAAAFGPRNCLLVRFLRFELAENSFDSGVEVWPGLLETIVEYLPNLKQLVVWTCLESGKAIGYSSRSRASGTLLRASSADDRRAAIWKFAAFVALRHGNLRRVTLWRSSFSYDGTIADSLISHVILDDGTLRNKFIAEIAASNASQSADARRGQDTMVQSDNTTPNRELLDPALVRRTKWNAIASLPASHFRISQDTLRSYENCQSSHAHNIYATYVDQQSFVTEDHRVQQGWLKRTNEELIDLCDDYVSRLDLSSEEHLERFLIDAELVTKKRLDLERQLKEARDELGTMADDFSDLQRRYDWAVDERNNAVNALREQTNSVQEDRLARQYSGLVRFGLHDWYRGTRVRRW